MEKEKEKSEESVENERKRVLSTYVRGEERRWCAWCGLKLYSPTTPHLIQVCCWPYLDLGQMTFYIGQVEFGWKSKKIFRTARLLQLIWASFDQLFVFNQTLLTPYWEWEARRELGFKYFLNTWARGRGRGGKWQSHKRGMRSVLS